jgi:type IV pilus assembly protein PilY1
MTTINKFLNNAGKFIILAAVMANAHGAITDIAQGPLVTSSSSTQPVKPNVFLMMDDSGSMGWDFMPDDAQNFINAYGYTSSQCNGVYYDSAITHAAPVKADGTSYPDATFTAAWVDGYNTGFGTTNLNTGFSSGGSATGSAFYYAYSGTQTTNALKNYANTASTFYQECNSAIGSAPGNAVFKKYRLAPTETTTIAISGTSSTSVSGITVNGKQMMSAASGTATTSSSTLASNIASKINLCTAALSGSCTVVGYSATVSGSTVTITGPTTAANFTPVIAQSGSMTLTTDVFPDTTASKLTNFANWYSYYSIRLNMMKTATGLAFKNIGSNYRVGFATMNNNGGTDFLNLAPFVNTTSPVSTQRTDFYAKLYGTP